jgi:hypothetical protein
MKVLIIAFLMLEVQQTCHTADAFLYTSTLNNHIASLFPILPLKTNDFFCATLSVWWRRLLHLHLPPLVHPPRHKTSPRRRRRRNWVRQHTRRHSLRWQRDRAWAAGHECGRHLRPSMTHCLSGQPVLPLPQSRGNEPPLPRRCRCRCRCQNLVQYLRVHLRLQPFVVPI